MRKIRTGSPQTTDTLGNVGGELVRTLASDTTLGVWRLCRIDPRDLEFAIDVKGGAPAKYNNISLVTYTATEPRFAAQCSPPDNARS